ncbi:MAG: hypothetical protein HYX61_12405 [Gammaproteobacteria bacterium]|jgi:hypothetical protein|nr:hypothetical protein [Gammaproteobacteria bacterium]
MSDPIEHIAGKLARFAWQTTGLVLGQGALGYAAHAATTSESRNPFNYVLSWLNPFTLLNPLSWIKNPLEKAKKAAMFSGLEAGAYPFSQAIATNWDKTTPLAEKFMTPIIASIIRPALETLSNEGMISIHNTQRTSWLGMLSPMWLAKNISSGVYNVVTWPYGVIGNWWHGKDPRTVYQILDEAAPQAGRLVANGIEATAQYASKAMHGPSDMIQAISQATGIPYPFVLAGTIAAAGFGYYCLRSGWTNITNIVNVKTTVNTSAAATGNNMGGVHIHLDGKQQPQILHAATTATGNNGQQIPPITIVTKTEDETNKAKLT